MFMLFVADHWSQGSLVLNASPLAGIIRTSQINLCLLMRQGFDATHAASNRIQILINNRQKKPPIRPQGPKEDSSSYYNNRRQYFNQLTKTSLT
jgi:hypothetical protein